MELLGVVLAVALGGLAVVLLLTAISGAVRYIPNNRLGQKILEALYQWEERFPRAFVKHGQYPTIVLTKR